MSHVLSCLFEDVNSWRTLAVDVCQRKEASLALLYVYEGVIS